MTQYVRCAFGLLITSALCACSTAPRGTADLPLYTGRALDSYQLVVANPESDQVFTGQAVTVPKPPGSKMTDQAVSAEAATKDAPNDAVTLRWKDVWYAGLRLEGGNALDLTPYLDKGTLEFDLKVNELAKGGLVLKVDCGKDCERKVSHVLPAREAAGKGWQHLSFSMKCFVRDGDNFSAITRPFAVEGTGKGDISIANIVMNKAGTPNTTCPDYKTVSVTPGKLDESWSIDWWLPRHQAKLDEVKAMKARNINPEVVFIGDSITNDWEKDGAKVWAANYRQYNALNLGFSGDRTENVLWRLQHGAVDGIAPKLAVLMFGTNNTGHRLEDPATTTAGIARNIEELQKRLPNTRILLLAIFPRDETPSGPLRQINARINTMLAKLADNRSVYFLDINHAFLTADGTLSREIMPDLLHPNEKGYQLWADAMRPELTRLLQQK